MSTYATPAQLRGELELDAGDTAALSDEAAERLLVNAEDRIDSILPERILSLRTALLVDPDPLTGRTVDPARLEPWQADKLARATCKAAAVERRDPKAFEAARYKSVKGPDFEYGEPLAAAGGGAAMPLEVGALLVQAKLLPATARV